MVMLPLVIGDVALAMLPLTEIDCGPAIDPVRITMPLPLSAAVKLLVKLFAKLPPAGVLLGLLIFCVKAAATCAAVKSRVAVKVSPPTVALSPFAKLLKVIVCCALVGALTVGTPSTIVVGVKF